jgi:adapter protein MecA 1/2
MRIDKINDNQIRCFLSKEDMESRQLHLKELAYGTEKARALFHELLREARARFGFEVENMPVMVEAVPLQDDSLVLIVTKVDNPEELDTRFSSFSPSVKSGPPDVDTASTSALSQLLEAIRKEIDGDGGSTPEAGQAPAAEKRPAAAADGRKSSSADTKNKNKKTGKSPGIHLYTFSSLGKAAAAAAAAPAFPGKSSLYRDPSDSVYYLFLTVTEDQQADSSRVLSTLSEFGDEKHITPAREQDLREHCEVLSAESAFQKLTELGGQL